MERSPNPAKSQTVNPRLAGRPATAPPQSKPAEVSPPTDVSPPADASSPVAVARHDLNSGVKPAAARAADGAPAVARPVAVIDIGVSSIRMTIAEIRQGVAVEDITAGKTNDHVGTDDHRPADDHGAMDDHRVAIGPRVRKLETMIQSVQLGRDVFDGRRLRRTSIEAAVKILGGYRKVWRSYGVDESCDVRLVATTAVREAANALAFTDRVFVATGLTIEVIDEAEVNRITYVAVMPHLRSHRELYDGKTVVVEVGGGTTEQLIIRSGNVLHSGSYRLGSLRSLRELEDFRTGVSKRRGMLEQHMRRTLVQMTETIRRDTAIELLALGGDVRFAAHRILNDWDGIGLAKLPIKAFNRFVDRVLPMSADQIVNRFGASFIEAETLGAALLVYQMLATEFGLTHLYVGDTNLRDGLLYDLSMGFDWSSDFANQIQRSAISMGRGFGFDETHARNVAESSRSLFDQMQSIHGLTSRHQVLLTVAALLHEIGNVVNVRSNHKHAMYLIRHSDLFGLSRRDLLLVALIVRYHRRAYPQPSHEGFATLDQDDRVAVAKLAAILRLAIALDDRRIGRIRGVGVDHDGATVTLIATGVNEVGLEQVAMRENRGLFRDVFGLNVRLKCDSKG